jgi:hypothetical protein
MKRLATQQARARDEAIETQIAEEVYGAIDG